MTPPNPQSPTSEDKKLLADLKAQGLPILDCTEVYSSIPSAAPTAQALAEEIERQVRASGSCGWLTRSVLPDIMAVVTPVLAKLVGENERLTAQHDLIQPQIVLPANVPKSYMELCTDLATARAERDAAVKELGQAREMVETWRVRSQAHQQAAESARQEAADLRGEVERLKKLNDQKWHDAELGESYRIQLETERRANKPRKNSCCDNERRNMNGGCDNCGDPAL